MQTVTITIGRNVGSTPMHDESWGTFKNDVATLLSQTFSVEAARIEIHTGMGVWESVQEESVKLSAHTGGHYTDWELRTLKLDLAVIADRYSQDAVAFEVSECTLVWSAAARNAVVVGL